ncbi:hypothetical protein P608_09700 [Comamonas thiooxydans]|uniref:Uncharacterized protein n=2 Tax=Comamonas TaxID=283 RepID=A0A0E3BWA0_9BURK|nr:hypothetical protein O987_22275 [Comamonas testosteroni TK102]KGG91645.1 hypothetical protein P245_13660 [Comamonas thiooxydans]KGH12904.1 hypothetical protein P608_09700 [Comamonas thiooxydans]KGH24005.1 hypothetical protein P606_09915 [Comamonas thiooxydans]KGH25633.1 hypothetical protein P607_05290 [Comamonas thiooxydans]
MRNSDGGSNWAGMVSVLTPLSQATPSSATADSRNLYYEILPEDA